MNQPPNENRGLTQRIRLDHDGRGRKDRGPKARPGPERLTYLLAHFDELGDQVQRYGAGDQGRLIAVLEYTGLARGITKVTTEGEQPLPPGAVY